jgi:hypothetical protein
VDGADNPLALRPPPVDDNNDTRNHPEKGPIILRYQGELIRTVLKLRVTSAEKAWLLFVNVIQKFRNAV